MRLVQTDKSKIKKRAKLYKLLDEFAASGYECAKIEGGAEHYKAPNVGQFTIRRAIKHYKFYGIKCLVSEGELYLIRTDLEV